MPVSANWPEYTLTKPILMVSAACAGAPAASAAANPARPHRNFCIASSLIFIVIGTLVALILLQLRGERNAPLSAAGRAGQAGLFSAGKSGHKGPAQGIGFG